MKKWENVTQDEYQTMLEALGLVEGETAPTHKKVTKSEYTALTFRFAEAKNDARRMLREALNRCTDVTLTAEDILRVVGAHYGPSPR